MPFICRPSMSPFGLCPRYIHMYNLTKYKIPYVFEKSCLECIPHIPVWTNKRERGLSKFIRQYPAVHFASFSSIDTGTNSCSILCSQCVQARADAPWSNFFCHIRHVNALGKPLDVKPTTAPTGSALE